MKIKTIAARTVNLLRGRNVRAASPHTSFRGLNNLLRKDNRLQAQISKNIRQRLGSGNTTINELVRLAVEKAPALRQMIGVRLMKEFLLHEQAVELLAEHLKSDVCEADLKQVSVKARPARGQGFGARIEAPVYEVTREYTVRKWAQDTLRGIFAISANDVLRDRIVNLLDSAPPLKEKAGTVTGEYEYRDKQIDQAEKD